VGLEEAEVDLEAAEKGTREEFEPGVHVNGRHRKHLELLDAIAIKDDKVGLYRMVG
jgi:hypothetical protein